MGMFWNQVGTLVKINAFRVKHSIPDDIYIHLGPLLDRAATPICDPDTFEMPFSLSSIVKGSVQFLLHPLLRECFHFWELDLPNLLRTPLR